MSNYEPLVHVFLISFPAQGHVTPLLRLGHALASKGLLVTFSVPEIFGRRMKKSNNLTDGPTPVGDGFLRFEFFADEWPKDEPRRQDIRHYLPHLELVGKKVVPKMLHENEAQGRPVSCLIHNPFLPWVSDVGETLGLPTAMLWVHSCASFATYYHSFCGTVPFPSESDPANAVQLPSMPLLKRDEVPTFLHPENPFSFLGDTMCSSGNFDKPFCILMDTFQELEREIVDHVSNVRPIRTVGPLFKNPNAVSHSAVSDGCIEWLDSKPASSVVYVSFGSVVKLTQEQVEELARGFLQSDLSFLWVMNIKQYHSLSWFLEKVGDKGKVVEWSPQERVLAHPSVVCHVSHCGWNSTVESIAAGTPVVAFPQWGDQVINAKYLVDEWKMGIRMCRGKAENRVVTGNEVAKLLLEAVVGAKAEEIKENALKWKAASEAGGAYSDGNIQAFVEEVRSISVALKTKQIKQ